jgi:hypothetical protein
MAKFVKGEVVVIPFPFSDLSGSKRRPALVLADLPGADLILCQITSQNSPKDPFAIPLDASDFKYRQPARCFEHPPKPDFYSRQKPDCPVSRGCIGCALSFRFQCDYQHHPAINFNEKPCPPSPSASSPKTKKPKPPASTLVTAG